MNIFDRIALRLRNLISSSEVFSDGSVISHVNRDEVLYKRPDGKSVQVYVFVTGWNSEFDRVIVKNSLARWAAPNATLEINEEEQQEIIGKVSKYFHRSRLGLGVDKSRDPIPV